MNNDPMFSDSTEHHKPIEPMKEIYRNPYEIHPYYGQVSPPPLRRKHRWLIIGIVSAVLLLILTVLIVVQLFVQLIQAGKLSKTPLVVQDIFGKYKCYVVSKDDPNLVIIFDNPNSNIVYRDCKMFMEQAQGGGYYSKSSSIPLKDHESNNQRCDGNSADNTYWQVNSSLDDQRAETICHTLEQILPPKQG